MFRNAYFTNTFTTTFNLHLSTLHRNYSCVNDLFNSIQPPLAEWHYLCLCRLGGICASRRIFLMKTSLERGSSLLPLKNVWDCYIKKNISSRKRLKTCLNALFFIELKHFFLPPEAARSHHEQYANIFVKEFT